MCTSLIHRKDDIFIAMNFDNNGMPFQVNTKNPSEFTVLVDSGRGKYLSFGINSYGVFCNNLIVSSNGKGHYRRASKTVTHTSKLTGDILSGTISSDKIGEYLDTVEVVNVPNLSVHNMIVDAEGNVWAVEPGRGIIVSPANKSPYFVMTNFSLCDCAMTKIPIGGGADRYLTATALLDEIEHMNVDKAFEVLKATKQSNKDWKTVFSMVYSQKEHEVYYCFDGNFDNILAFRFAA